MKRYSNDIQLARDTAEKTGMTVQEVLDELDAQLDRDLKYTSDWAQMQS